MTLYQFNALDDIAAAIETWFDKLDKQTKKEIYREGNLQNTSVIYLNGSPLE